MDRCSPGAAGRRRRTLVALVAVVVGVAAALVVLPRWAATSTSTSPSATVAPSAPAPTTVTPLTPTTAPAPPVCDRRPQLDTGAADPPAEWTGRLLRAVADPAWADLQRSISVWVEGYGEIVAVEPDTSLLPASNEKLLTALGARLLLDPAARFRTEVRMAGDQLVLVAGGDPTLRARGEHSLAALAEQVRAAGVAQVTGILVDASHFEPSTAARGWQDWQIPAYVGPMSALVIDDNRGRTDDAYLADPALGNAEAFAGALRAAGVRVTGSVSHGAAEPTAPLIAVLDSPTSAELTHDMLLHSDNEIAEALVRAIGDGSTEAGLARIATALDPWCLHLAGAAGDGSGLSREDRRSAREWRRLLQVALEQPWSDELWAGLPVAGRSGTLSGRLTGPATNGQVMAKTGTIIGGSALSGYATTPDGRQVVFSIIVNGEPGAANRAIAAIDRLVTDVAAG